MRLVEVGQDVFWCQVGKGVKGAGVEPDVDEAKLVYSRALQKMVKSTSLDYDNVLLV